MAREKRETANVLLAQGIDPGQQNSRKKEAAAELVFSTFENIAREWHDKFKDRWTEKNAKVILARNAAGYFPQHRKYTHRELKAPQLLDVVRRIDDRGALDYAHRALQYYSMVFRYAIANGRPSTTLSPICAVPNASFFYFDAKQEKTRQTRLEKIVDRLNRNLKPM